MVTADLLAVLCCPATHQPLAVATPEQIAQANRPHATRASGAPVNQVVVEGLVRKDGAVLYPVLDNIPCLLPGEGILLK